MYSHSHAIRISCINCCCVVLIVGFGFINLKFLVWQLPGLLVLFLKNSDHDMLNKNTLGIKKCKEQVHRCNKNFDISAEALLYQKYFNSLNDIQ